MDETGCGRKDGFLSKGGTATGWVVVKLQGKKAPHWLPKLAVISRQII